MERRTAEGVTARRDGHKTMSFSEKAKLTALAIVHIFETSKPMGNYAAVAVLNDGAGVSYGISQFTHKSGSLEAVVYRFQDICRRAGTQQLLVGYERRLRDRSALSIHELAGDARFKNGLKAAAERSEMQQAQREIAFEQYLKPAIDACTGSGFVLPMSLAVVYDSMNHGSWAKIRDLVPAHLSEKDWVKTYVTKRDAWLESVQRLRPTAYRTDFFLAQTARGNWDLDLPMNVNGYRLTEKDIPTSDFADLSDDGIDLDIPTVPAPAGPETEAVGAPINAPADAPVTTAAPTESVTPPSAVTVDVAAPEPTGFLSKLKKSGASALAAIGGAAGFKEWFGISLSAETADLLKVLLPTLMILGFIGIVIWYVSEKVAGFKTLAFTSQINADPEMHNVNIVSQ